MIRQCTDVSSSASHSASCSSRSIWLEMALSFSGRLSVIRATPPSISYSMCSNVGVPTAAMVRRKLPRMAGRHHPTRERVPAARSRGRLFRDRTQIVVDHTLVLEALHGAQAVVLPALPLVLRKLGRGIGAVQLLDAGP